VEVRDRRNWNKLIHTHPLNSSVSLELILQQHVLYIAAPHPSDLQFTQLSILNHEASKLVDLGPLSQARSLPAFARRPLFLDRLGALSNFYSWGRDGSTIEMGMLYSHNNREMRKFEIGVV
jgi:hypothetical protein